MCTPAAALQIAESKGSWPLPCRACLETFWAAPSFSGPELTSLQRLVVQSPWLIHKGNGKPSSFLLPPSPSRLLLLP